jgi:DHA1 family bicyclomycin/chloramphenicol resistance-like MFS transporter
VVAMAMVRDLFGGKPLVRMLARLALVNGLAPVLAPVIGSQLLRVMDWRGVFGFLAAYGALVLIAVAVFIVETLPPERRHAAGHSTARERFGALFHDRVFIGVSIVGGMVFASILTYVSSSPFLLQDVYGVDAQQFGLLFGLNSIGLVIASQLASRLMRRIGPQWILAVGLVFVAAAAIALIVLADSEAGVFSVIVPFFVLVSACGLCFPCAQVLALANHGDEAGTAAAVTGSANATIAGLVSPIPGIIGLTSGAPVGLVVGIAVAIALIALWAIVRPWSVPALAD